MFASTVIDQAPETSNVEINEPLTAEEARGYAKVLDCYADILGITKHDILRDMVRTGTVRNSKATAEVLSQVR